MRSRSATRAEEWPQESLFALASIYGIELLEDNHRDAKAIMLAEFLGFHQAHGVPCGPDTSLRRPRPSSSTPTSFAATL